jgi:hypothetical protein
VGIYSPASSTIGDCGEVVFVFSVADRTIVTACTAVNVRTWVSMICMFSSVEIWSSAYVP